MIENKPTIYNTPTIYKTGAGGGGGGGGEDIGGRQYRTVEINGVTWLAENLNLVFPGVKFGKYYDDHNPCCCYYNNRTQEIEPHYGLLYNWYAVNLLQTNKNLYIPGWRVATRQDWIDLINYVGANSGKKLKSVEGWDNNGGGTDDFGFTALPAGLFQSNAYSNKGTQAHFWTSTAYDSTYKWEYVFYDNSNNFTTGGQSSVNYHSIRLVKE